jgi:hypothetical protein
VTRRPWGRRVDVVRWPPAPLPPLTPEAATAAATRLRAPLREPSAPSFWLPYVGQPGWLVLVALPQVRNLTPLPSTEPVVG